MLRDKNKNLITDVLTQLTNCFWHCLIFSCLINILSLALPIYSMQVLDRVLGSSSVETLIWLSIIIFLAAIAMNFLTGVRDSAFSYIGNSFEKKLSTQTITPNPPNIASKPTSEAGIYGIQEA